MKAFLDTNVLIDLFIPSRERHRDALKVVEMIIRGFFQGAVSTQSIIDASYIVGRLDKEAYSYFKEKLDKLIDAIEDDGFYVGIPDYVSPRVVVLECEEDD